MDLFELNKIAGAVLFAALVAFGLNLVSDLIFEGHEPEAPGYVIEVAEAGGEEKVAEEPAEEPIAQLLASADAGAGENVAKKCAACHSYDKGGANKVGPALWDIVNRPVAAAEGFRYSDAMKAFADGSKVWDYEHLNGFLAAPKQFVSGTSMGFAGLKKPAERADMIAYLRSLADNPAPLPEAEAAAEAPPGEAAPAETAQAEAAPAEAAPAETAPAEAAQVEAAPAETAPAETAQAEAAPAEAAPAGTSSPAVAMIGQMSAEDGKKIARKCTSCHAFEEGGKNRIGPPLWGIVNGAVAAKDDYRYSDAMKAFAENGAVWDYAKLDAFLADPKGTVPKTKMSFTGLKKDEDRAALLAYMRTLAGEPAPLP